MIRAGPDEHVPMRAEELFQRLTEVLYIVIFIAVLAGAIRRPTRVAMDMVLFFGDVALITLAGIAARVLDVNPSTTVSDVEASLLMALPYLLLRLVADFMPVRAWLLRAAEVGLILSVIALFALDPPYPVVLVVLLVAYFVMVTLYASLAFWAAARHSTGVTRRRLQAVAVGSMFIGLVILLAGLSAVVPPLSGLLGTFGTIFGMCSALAYVLGFAPPTWLRRAWQEPELRAFLERAATLPHLPDTPSIVRELQRGATQTTGASGAAIGLWDESAGVLRLFTDEPERLPEAAATTEGGRVMRHTAEGWEVAPDSATLSARVMREGRALFTTDLVHDDPANAALYAAYGSSAAVGAPIVAGDRRLGALVVYAQRAPIFADSDMDLVQLLADQAAVILESRKLLDAATVAHARAEATRMKEDFLSSAAHDLKTPITGILTQAQVLERRLDRQPSLTDRRVPDGVQRIINEARRLSALVGELLDGSLLEQGRLVNVLESVDLVELATESCGRRPRGSHVTCRVESSGAVVGTLDPVRVRQLIEQLVDNAVKFSRPDGEVVVRVWTEGDSGRIDVLDEGIGIPPNDLPRLFERFHRGSNVDDRRFAGLGLGLYISRGIVEQHGGSIWAASQVGSGTTMSVRLPLHGSAVRVPMSLQAGGVQARA
jgi:signal transduction histidine kinase